MIVVIAMAGCVTAKWPRLDPGVVVVIARSSQNDPIILVIF